MEVFKFLILIILLLIFNINGKSKERNETKLSDTFQELAEIIINNERQDISQTINILKFIENIYIDHGYHESGNWKFYSSKNLENIRERDFHFDSIEFQVPCVGIITSFYGYRPKFRKIHKGVDFSLNIGDTVHCVLPGIISEIGYDTKGYGKYVKVEHSNGLETIYAHLSSEVVSKGQKIKAGEALGLGGKSGNATGPHLHFETRFYGTTIDPLSCLNLISNGK